MKDLKALVIFDLETTGLPAQEHNCTKIVEMSFVGCIISQCQGEELPRVINTLTLALNPMKRISPNASKVNGLHNELLEEMKPFDDDVVTLVNKFIERLPQPVCLIAHNGLAFDFPIFRRQLKFCQAKLLDNILCADSLLAFRSFLPKPVKCNGLSNSQCSSSRSMEKSSSSPMSQNETTPNKKTIPQNISPVKSEVQYPKPREIGKAVRKLVFDSEDDCIILPNDSQCSSVQYEINECDLGYDIKSGNQNKVLRSYKLRDIYNFLHDNEEHNFHTSGDDCMALLSCINKCRDEFLRWLPDNMKLLNEIEPLF
ncbi:UNVERIFIED_CONTAM: hypothetical protein PYX00_001550 [Menopon gallinae]|uniref:Exonuclease domain-containing protein n=1 Tax=Menopon gallinae TaxID=328185 RepID=A0AAW2IEJ3_9NEOP